MRVPPQPDHRPSVSNYVGGDCVRIQTNCATSRSHRPLTPMADFTHLGTSGQTVKPAKSLGWFYFPVVPINRNEESRMIGAIELARGERERPEASRRFAYQLKSRRGVSNRNRFSVPGTSSFRTKRGQGYSADCSQTAVAAVPTGSS